MTPAYHLILQLAFCGVGLVAACVFFYGCFLLAESIGSIYRIAKDRFR